MYVLYHNLGKSATAEIHCERCKMQAAWYIADRMSGEILACSECAEKLDADDLATRAEEQLQDRKTDLEVERKMEEQYENL